ncbi:MAG: hypothetical protein ACJ8DY_03820, partial [Xanthobacteraceae bacterium]
YAMSNITPRSSSEELADPSTISREQVLERLRDWRDRVHRLYGEIELTLHGTSFQLDREGKHTSAEELTQRIGVTSDEQPKLDILRIVRPGGTNAAIFFPRGLWVIGANGRIDLRIIPTVGQVETYVLVDESQPLSGPAKWIRMPIGAPFEREPFSPSWLISKLR